MRFNLKSKTIKTVYILIDLAIMYIGIFSSCLVRHKLINFSLSFFGFLVDSQNPFRFILLLWMLTTIFFMNMNALYQTRREVSEWVEIWLVIKAVFFSSLLTVVAIYALKLQEFPRTVFMNSMLAMMILLSLWRIAKRWFVEYLVRGGYNNFNVLIIGAGKVGATLAQEILRRPGMGIKIIGFLDDTQTGQAGVKDLKVIGKIFDFSEIARKEFINKIFITMYPDSHVFSNILEQAKEMNIAVRVVPQGFELTSGELYRYNIGFVPILEYADVENLRKQVGKRFFDFIMSLFLFFIFLPVFAVMAVMVKMDSPGPVFYFSKRYGRRGQIFHMYKFRSMTINAEQIIKELRHKNEADGPIFKIKKDPRVTRFGQFLRKYSLDELPQIINVLKGEMSLVGPRPFPIDQIEKEDLRQLKRLEVRPGITGLWQVRGRSDISFSRLVKWDIWYINNWSFGLDFSILLQTIPVVIKGKGAY